MSVPREVYRRELGAFLRAHRERMRPSDVGLEESSRRRTPGLRREEVAALAGLGLTWYTWLEQGRVSPSSQVLGAVARVLRLSGEEAAHAMALGGFRPVEQPDRSAQVASAFRALTAGWSASPAALVDRHLDLIEWNEAFASLWSDPVAAPPARRNLLLSVLGSAEALRVRPPDRSSMAWDLAKQLRAQAARSPDERFGQVFAQLREDHPELGAWWRCKSVGEFATRGVVVCGIDFTVSMLRPAEAPDCAFLVQTPSAPADRARMTRLLTVGLSPTG